MGLRKKGPKNLVWNIVRSEKLYNFNMELKPSRCSKIINIKTRGWRGGAVTAPWHEHLIALVLGRVNIDGVPGEL